MADSTSPAGQNKVLLASIVQHLAKLANQNSGDSAEAIQMAIDAIVANLNISKDDFVQSSCVPDLDTAFSTSCSAKSPACGEHFPHYPKVI